MTIRIGINGYGRIGQLVHRAACERDDIEVVAINGRTGSHNKEYKLKYDSTHGRFKGEVYYEGEILMVNGKPVRITNEESPATIDWQAVDVDVVVEATGAFLTDETTRPHLKGGAKKVVMTGPSKDSTPMFVMGVNHTNYNGEDIISNASCTTNCLAPIAKVLNDTWGIESGLMSTVHAVTASQNTVDGSASKWRNGRGAYQNIIPASTGAAKAVGIVIPELQGKLTGMSFRVPVANVSVIDLTVNLTKPATYAEICAKMKEVSQGEMKGIIGYTEDEVVSSDFIGETCTAVFDAGAGMALTDRFVKVVAWYDNEWAYSEKILDLVAYIMK